MSSKPLLIFDFDGVIIDGIFEYWSSSRKACLNLIGEKDSSNVLPQQIPHSFKKLRPWVTHGWEMVLIAAELLRKESPLINSNATIFSNDYQNNCDNALQSWKWTSQDLQIALDHVRKEAIKNDLKSWLASHKPFPQVIERIKQLNNEDIDFAVLTTKNAEFTSQLLKSLNLKPKLLYGHESGSKPNVLLQLSKDQKIKGFIEDRRATLETVLNTPGLSFLPCYLAGWGYLKDGEAKALPPNIYLLELKTFLTPLASWPSFARVRLYYKEQ